MGDIECVVDGCDYSADSVRSVEGHISGRKDEEHRGNGRMYRDELVTQKEKALNEPEPVGDGEGAEGEEEPSESVDVEESDSDPEGVEAASPSAVAPAAAGVGLLGSVGAGSDGSKLPLILGGLLLALLLVSVLSGEASSSDEAATEEPAPSTATEEVQRGGLNG